MHTAPTDLPLGGQALAMLFCDITSPPERVSHEPLVILNIGGPGTRIAGRIDANRTVAAYTELFELGTDPTRFFDLAQKGFALLGVAQ